MKSDFYSKIILTGWVMIFVVVAACDSSPPAANTTRNSVSSDRATTIEETFENTDDWETISGRWSLDKNGERTVLKQTATDNRYPVILLREPEFSDVDVTVQFRPISGKIDASGGIVFRALDGANYYNVRANSLEDNFRLYATVAGSRRQIASTKVDPPQIGEWHTLRVVAVGDHIQAYLNGKLLIDHRDSRFQSGHVGLWTKADAVTQFADFKVLGVVSKNSR